MAAGAEQLKVDELVAAAVAERHTVMYLEPVARAAADAGSVAGVDGGARAPQGSALVYPGEGRLLTCTRGADEWTALIAAPPRPVSMRHTFARSDPRRQPFYLAVMGERRAIDKTYGHMLPDEDYGGSWRSTVVWPVATSGQEKTRVSGFRGAPRFELGPRPQTSALTRLRHAPRRCAR